MTSDNNDTLCLVNDISGMYIHYMFNPKYSELKINPSTWSTFLRMKFLSVKVNFIKKNKLTVDWNADHQRKTMKLKQISRNFTNRFKKNFKLIFEIYDNPIKIESHLVHYPQRSNEEQETIVKKTLRTQISCHFQYKDVFYSIIKELDEFGGEFHRMPY